MENKQQILAKRPLGVPDEETWTFTSTPTRALEDGEIDTEERANIENLRKRYDISEDHVKAIIEVLKDKSTTNN